MLGLVAGDLSHMSLGVAEALAGNMDPLLAGNMRKGCAIRGRIG